MSEITENGNWDDDFAPKDSTPKNTEGSDDQRKVPWLKFEKPGEYRIRLCGNFVRFHRWWSPFTTRVITHLSYKDEDPAWNAGFWPRKTFAIHVIDRNDKDADHPTGKLKILEKGASVFEAFANYKRINKVNPAGKQGPDFVIEVEWPKGNKRNATYKVTPVMKISEWTEKEVEMIKNEHADLKKIYAPTPLDKIKEAWDALPEDAKIPPKREGEEKGKFVPSERSAPSSKPAQTKAPVETVSVAEEDDLFGGDDEDSTGF
jgi:hypothetical protein